MEESNSKRTKVITDVVRLSYVHVFEPYAFKEGDEPKYCCTVLVPKTDKVTRNKIKAAIEAAKEEGLDKIKDKNGNIPQNLALPYHDGDGVKPESGEEYGPECKGHFVISATSKQPPGVVDKNLNPVINKALVYSGVYARVSLNFFAYNNRKKGIGCGLNNIQIVRDGEPLAGRSRPEEDFEAFSDGDDDYDDGGL